MPAETAGASQRAARVPDEEMTDELEQLRTRLEEAEETLLAIRSGQVDALVVSAPQGDQVYVLQSADQPYRLLVEQMREGAATLSPDGDILFCNSYLAGMLGRPQPRVQGEALQQFVAPADQPIFAGLLRAALSGSSQGEIGLLAEDGRVVPAHVALSALRSEGQPALTLVATDLTEQRRNQEIIAAQRLARSILDQASDAIVTCDRSGLIIGANHAALRLAPANPVGMPFAEAFALAASGPMEQPSGQPRELDVIGPALAGLSRGPLEASLASGAATVELLVAASPLLDASEGQLGCIVTMTDITERKRAETAERAARATAEAAAERLARLQAATAEFSAAQSPQEVVAVVTRHSIAALRCDAAVVELLTADGRHLEIAGFMGSLADGGEMGTRRPLAGAGVGRDVIREGSPRWVRATGEPGAPGETLFGTMVYLPLQNRGEKLGLIRIGYRARRDFEAGERQFLLAIAGQCAQALERARLYEAERLARLHLEERVLDRTRQLRALGERLESSREEERLRISREIHDQLGAQLTGLKIDIAQIRKRLPELSPELTSKVEGLSAAVDTIVQLVRRIAADLRPGLLDDFGLPAAIEWELQQFEKRTEIACQLTVAEAEVSLAHEQVTAVFRVFQEALTNVMRHARATRVEVEVGQEAGQLVLTIRDNGRGIGSATLENPTSLGLLGMRERMRQAGGDLTLESAPGEGTRVTLRAGKVHG